MKLKNMCESATAQVLPCWCSEAYMSRNIEVHNCPRHNFAEMVTDAMERVAKEFARMAIESSFRRLDHDIANAIKLAENDE